MRATEITACRSQFSETLQRERFARCGSHRVVHVPSARQVPAGFVEATRQELGFTAQRRGERMTASRTETLGFLGEGIGPSDDVLIGP
jgi:hypothetical protein